MKTAIPKDCCKPTIERVDKSGEAAACPTCGLKWIKPWFVSERVTGDGPFVTLTIDREKPTP